MAHYILYTRDDGLWLVGPFASKEAREAFTEAPMTIAQMKSCSTDAEHGLRHNPADDPRWQALELDDSLISAGYDKEGRHVGRLSVLVLSSDRHLEVMAAGDAATTRMPEGI